MGRLIFVTHPEVVIDPAVPVPEWPLSQRGRERMTAFAHKLAQDEISQIWSSAERRAESGRRGRDPQPSLGLRLFG